MKTVLQSKCVWCKKISREDVSVPRFTEDGQIAITLECGHIVYQEAMAAADENVEIVSSDGRSPFPYQWETVRFIEAADCNGLILHEQGLGKTIIECMLLKRNKDLLPALIVAPSGLRLQWMAEVLRWTGIMPQVITSSQDKPIFEIFPIVIVSVDTLRLLRPDISGDDDENGLQWVDGKLETKKKKKPLWDDALVGRFKHICVDESQKIKNSGSSRTQALRKFAALANNGKKARVTCMSGTNIEKHAGEFFVTLNLVRPELFPQESVYKLHHCEVQPETGKIGGLKDPTRFKDLTKDFIIRYKRAEVLPDLPKVFRQFRLAEMEGGALQEYIKVVKDFQDYMEDVEKVKNATDILGYLAKMRHITGVAKVNAAAEFIEEFLLENDDDRKLVVFLHHKRAGAFLMDKLTKLCKDGAFAPPLYLNADLDIQQRMALIEDFKKPGNRIMLASTLAAGVGLNLQFCSDCLIMERQWNPSQEEQAEGRFPRPGATMDKVNAVYLIAAGTIDDFLTQLVEEKRRNVKNTLDFEEVTWDERGLIMELARVIANKGLQRWKLSNRR
jgi:SWI/SNF-related matrix-associated actin-dependent regulator of chromatin subfamily A-like protein 1